MRVEEYGSHARSARRYRDSEDSNRARPAIGHVADEISWRPARCGGGLNLVESVGAGVLLPSENLAHCRQRCPPDGDKPPDGSVAPPTGTDSHCEGCAPHLTSLDMLRQG
jgi:hypothetical protein